MLKIKELCNNLKQTMCNRYSFKNDYLVACFLTFRKKFVLKSILYLAILYKNKFLFSQVQIFSQFFTLFNNILLKRWRYLSSSQIKIRTIIYYSKGW